MPIYEYRCHECRKKFELLILSTDKASAVQCAHCESKKVERLISRVRVIRSEESLRASISDPSKMSFDENDPRSVAKWVKKIGKEAGEDIGDDAVDQMVEKAMQKKSKKQQDNTD
jgi:putative FmdB family regulatory protein